MLFHIHLFLEKLFVVRDNLWLFNCYRGNFDDFKEGIDHHTSTQVSPQDTEPHSHFKPAQGHTEIEELSKKKFANSFEKKICWVLGLYQQWCKYQISSFQCNPPILRSDLSISKLNTLSKTDLAYSLSCFITKIRKLNSKEYPPRTVYQMCVCLQMYLESNCLHWKILNKADLQFVDFYYVLDNVMKQKCAQGLGKVQSAEVISKEVENHMWQTRILGKDHPKQLSETILFMLGIYLVLQGGEEHKQLHRPGFNPQITVKTDIYGQQYLQYDEDPKSKTNQGGIDSNPRKLIHVLVFPNVNPARYLVRLYQKYMSLLPKGGKHHELYLYPMVKLTLCQWYNNRCIGVNTLHETVKRLANEAGLQGKFTNHSLRAIGVTHLFDNEILEKVIKEVSGHRSNAVQLYERTGEAMKCKVSATMSASEPEKIVHTLRKTSIPEITIEEPPSKRTVKINVQRCMASSSISQILDDILQDKVKSVTINVEIKYHQ